MKINSGNAKDTIYVDAEDDISAIIEKVRSSESRVVALVLPKRAATLQSIVNLKLLNRSAKNAQKSIVLITSETGLLPIAGAAGLHVAKTLQSKPEIPESPQLKNKIINTEAENVSSIEEPDIDTATSVGQLAGHVATEETIELDNESSTDLIASKTVSKNPFNKKFKVPNFNRFRVVLFGGLGLLVLLIVGGVFAFVILPKASIIIKTDTTNIQTDLVITAKTDTKEVDKTNLILPAENKNLNKSDTEKVVATGQRDDGDKAKGTVTITNCNADNDKGITLNSGTVISTSNGTSLGYVIDETVTIPQSDFTGSHVCKSNQFKNVTITAQKPGGQFNISANTSFTTSISGVSGKNGSALSGGSSKIVQVVSQTDADGAKQKAIDKMNGTAIDELKAQFVTDNALSLNDTFVAGEAKIVTTPNVNEPATEVSVSVTITFTMLGIKNEDLKQIVENDVSKHIDVSKQVIQDDGIKNARIQITDKKSAKEVKFSISTIVVAGPHLDANGIKDQVSGKSKQETQSIIHSRPGIIDVNISYQPFWVYSTPKNKSKITITFEQNEKP